MSQLNPIQGRWRLDADGCWLWTGYVKTNGYPQISRKGSTRSAHRASFELANGPIPAGMHVDHACHGRDKSCPGGKSCKHRRCVNPAHLEAVTSSQNTGRSTHCLATRNAAKTHCLRGHEFTTANTYLNARGSRICRKCVALHAAMYRARRRVATANESEES